MIQVALCILAVSSQPQSAQVDSLIAKLGTKDSFTAMKSLADIGAPAVPALVNVVKASKGAASAEAVSILSKIKDPRGIDAAILAYSGKDEDLARMAVESLPYYRSAKANDFLVAQLGKWKKGAPSPVPGAIAVVGPSISTKVLPLISSPNRGVRIEALQAIGYLNTPIPAAQLDSSLTDSDSEVKVTALFALMSFNDITVPESAIALLKDTNPEVRRAVLDLLSVNGTRAHTQKVLSLLEDSDESIVGSAIYTLGWMKDPLALPALQKLESHSKHGQAAKDSIKQITKWNPQNETLMHAQFLLEDGTSAKAAAEYFNSLSKPDLEARMKAAMDAATPGKLDMTALAYASANYEINPKDSVALMKKSLGPELDSDPDAWSYTPTALKKLFLRRPSAWLLEEIYSTSGDGDIAEDLEDAIGEIARKQMRMSLQVAAKRKEGIQSLAETLSLQVDMSSLDVEEEIVATLSKLAADSDKPLAALAKQALEKFKKVRRDNWLL